MTGKGVFHFIQSRAVVNTMRLRLDVSTDAQHDGAEGVIPSEAEESRGNERGGWFLIFAFT